MLKRNPVIVLGILLLGNTLLAQVPTDYIGYWPFSGNANDESGNGNNGNVYGASLAADRHQEASSAYNFDGSTDHINVAHSNDFDNIKAISFWFKPGYNIDGTHSNLAGLINKRLGQGPGDYAGFHIYIYGNADATHPQNGVMLIGDDPGIGTVTHAKTTNRQWNANTWYHIVVNLDGVGTVYVDGIDDTESTTLTNTSFTNVDVPLYFGRYQAGGSDYYEGSIDDIRFYNRILTSEEIQALYNESSDGGGDDGGSNTFWEKNNDDIYYNVGNVGIGTANLPSGYKLAVEGKIRAREVKIDLDTWSDFVFDETYTLPSLNEVEHHIINQKHLPGVPSESEVRENGIDVGEMNKILLQKIEELTLYIIELEKQSNTLTSQVQNYDSQFLILNKYLKAQQQEIEQLKTAIQEQNKVNE